MDSTASLFPFGPFPDKTDGAHWQEGKGNKTPPPAAPPPPAMTVLKTKLPEYYLDA